MVGWLFCVVLIYFCVIYVDVLFFYKSSLINWYSLFVWEISDIFVDGWMNFLYLLVWMIIERIFMMLIFVVKWRYVCLFFVIM